MEKGTHLTGQDDIIAKQLASIGYLQTDTALNLEIRWMFFLRQGMTYVTKTFSPQLPHIFWHRSPQPLTLFNELRQHYKKTPFVSDLCTISVNLEHR